MSRLTLVLPTPKYKDLVMGYKNEFVKNGESLDGAAELDKCDTFEDWYMHTCNLMLCQIGLIRILLHMAAILAIVLGLRREIRATAKNFYTKL